MTRRDGHVRVLPLHVANKIAAGEVVERPSSVVKELVENALDAGATNIRVSITQGGRKLVSVQDNGCGMTRDDAVLALERQATSKILDIDDIESIETLGFRGEAIPSIASVSRFTITTRRHDSDEGVRISVNAGTLADVSPAGCPPGTLVEVRDLFCNVPARRKFLRSYTTEECHVKSTFTVHAIAHPTIAFSLVIDTREVYRLAPAGTLADRVRDIFGAEFVESLLPLSFQPPAPAVRVSGYIERPNLSSSPTRHEQFVFVNGRPATAASIGYAVREAYPRRQGDAKPALFLFVDLPPNQVDVNVHPTKREVRFRNNAAVKAAVTQAIEEAIGARAMPSPPPHVEPPPQEEPRAETPPSRMESPMPRVEIPAHIDPPHAPTPIAVDLPLAADDEHGAKPWKWFRFLACTASGYLLVETDAGLVTINPYAARERIAFERLFHADGSCASDAVAQQLLIPESVQLSPVLAARLNAALGEIRAMGFTIEPFGRDTFKIDAIPPLTDAIPLADILATIANDLAEGGPRHGARWREERIAKSIARTFARTAIPLDEKGATQLVENLAACRMPYVCPRGKPIMIFTSTRELDRKFARE